MTVQNGTALAHAPAAINPLSPANMLIKGFDDLARFAKMVSESGMAPKNMNVQAIGVAVQMGLELGLAPMQALQSVAVINGRPGIFGDAAKGLCEASGVMEDYAQWFEVGGKKLVTPDGEPRTPTKAELAKDECTCCVMSKRRGRKPFVTTFSVADAKNAKLWGKPGPWSDYPTRMLMFRARGFNLRDNFSDILRGLKTVEELRDYPTSRPASVRVNVISSVPEPDQPHAEDVTPDPEPELVTADAVPEDEAGHLPGMGDAFEG